VARFLTPSLEHVQPFWFYVPVLLAGLFPWTPLFALLFRRRLYEDARMRLLVGWVLYGLIFFSAARNKLPGYLLPLLPAVAIVLAAALERVKGREYWLASCAVLLMALPTVAAMLPGALVSGLRRTPVAVSPAGLIFLAAAGVVWWLARTRSAEWGVLAIALAAGLAIVYMKYDTYPVLDRVVSVRAIWRDNRAAVAGGCFDNVGRTWEYGLNYYAGQGLPECGAGSKGVRIGVIERRLVMEAGK